MRRWYSPRGARRGLILAGVTAAVWIVWAEGYRQGITTVAPKGASGSITVPADTSCCLKRLEV